jgi:hypothetical protein
VRVTSTQVSLSGCEFATFDYPNLGPDHRFEADALYTAGGVPQEPVLAHFVGVLQGNSLTMFVGTAHGSHSFTTQLGGNCPPPCP